MASSRMDSLNGVNPPIRKIHFDQLTASDELKKTAQELGKGIAANDDLAKVRAVYD